MFQGEPGKVGRGTIGASECGHCNDRENDERECVPDEAAWAVRLSYGGLGV
jgi:hypothetical protein